MNWDRIEGNWKKFKGTFRQRWGKITFDRFEVAAGKSVYLSGQIQESRGVHTEETRSRRIARGRSNDAIGLIPSTPDIERYNSPALAAYTGSISTILADMRNGRPQ